MKFVYQSGMGNKVPKSQVRKADTSSLQLFQNGKWGTMDEGEIKDWELKKRCERNFEFANMAPSKMVQDAGVLLSAFGMFILEILQLPDEVLLRILRFATLEGPNEISLVCKHIRELSIDPAMRTLTGCVSAFHLFSSCKLENIMSLESVQEMTVQSSSQRRGTKAYIRSIVDIISSMMVELFANGTLQGRTLFNVNGGMVVAPLQGTWTKGPTLAKEQGC